jgi:hypothetical protein
MGYLELISGAYVLDRSGAHGLGTCLIEAVMGHPNLQGLRRFHLATRDAHGLYSRFGFRRIANPDCHMEIARPGMYRKRS